MDESFIKIVEKLYNLIKTTKDSIYKINIINRSKLKLGIDTFRSFGNYYDNLKKANEAGIVYTPEDIANYIIENTITSEDIIKNPFKRIIDPSCGVGNILIPCFRYLKSIYTDNLKMINSLNNLSLTNVSLVEHIIKNNLFGKDIDAIAIKILCIDMFLESEGMLSCNFYKSDFLLDECNDKYDIFIGNPPYIGHKLIDKDYSLKLREIFYNLYKDKSDISFCFFKKSLLCSSKNCKISYITSRYFMESQSGHSLRELLINETNIVSIVDFYGDRPFKKVGIDPVIVFLYGNKTMESNKEIEVLRRANEKLLLDTVINYTNIMGTVFSITNVNRKGLSSGPWILKSQGELNIINKIISKCKHSLQDICMSHQGIITGCDKAFIVDEAIIIQRKLEKEIVKPWIKSCNIQQGYVEKAKKYIIYSNLINDENEYPNCVSYIENYRSKLLTRRECIKGLRKWYELQWGRMQDIFEKDKIIFPYKCSNSKFVRNSGNYFSADIYALTIQNEDLISYDYLVYILNSKIYEYYFKSYAKKLGRSLYEYYPNNLMRLRIPTDFIGKLNSEEALYDYFGITEEEEKVINSY